MIRYRLGTTGFAYPDWQGVFYPTRSGRNQWLGIYAKQFNAVELNTTFHAVPTAERLRSWSLPVQPDFKFAVKTNRSITHEQPLNSALPPMLQFVQIIRSLGAALGPLLIQLPPHCSANSFDDLDRFLGALPTDLRYAVEFRHASWVGDRTTDLLRNHNAAWVGLDHLDHFHLRRLRATSDFLYIRLIGRHNRFENTDHERVDVMSSLHKWLGAIKREIDQSKGQIKEVWVLASNDYAGYAPATLRRFASLAGIPLPPAIVQAGLFSE